MFKNALYWLIINVFLMTRSRQCRFFGKLLGKIKSPESPRRQRVQTKERALKCAEQIRDPSLRSSCTEMLRGA